MRKSFWLLAIAVVLVFFFLLSTWSFDSLLSRVSSDALIINDLGMIRGAIQRWSKLVLAGEVNNPLALEISALISGYSGSSSTAMAELKRKWDSLQELGYSYGPRFDASVAQEIVTVSEECWALADSIVDQRQFASEGEMHRFTYFRVSFGLGMGIVAFLGFYVKSYVRDQLETDALNDPLTGAYNRRYFEDFGAREIARSNRARRTLAVVMYDLDHFKRVNDTYGHAVGDQVLKKLTQIVRDHIRKTDVLARVGGEEFAVLFPETDANSAQVIAEKLRAAVEEADFHPIETLTISIGVTGLVADDSLASALDRADKALYLAKEGGRNRVERL